MRPVQYFTEEYLKSCQEMSNEERLEYLENFRLLIDEVQMNDNEKQTEQKTKLISIKMPHHLLFLLKKRAQFEGLPYQRLMKNLLRKALQG